MAFKRKKQQKEGVPEWILTYGDMMSLLLCFFILLAAVSEMKKDDEYQNIVKAIQQAFGMIQGGGEAPVANPTQQSILEMLENIALYKEKMRKLSNADDPGITGRETTVTRIREGLQFTIGGLITFEPGSADLKPQAREELAKVADVIQGQNNKLEIRGHATGADLPAGTEFTNLWDLSYARARAVMQFLVDQQDIDPRRIRVTGCGDKEPLISRVYEPVQLAVNRRVELIVTETLIQEFDATDQSVSSAVE